MLEKRTHIAELYDYYGPLLTAKQREAMSLFYEEDYSLGEIAQAFGISRQGVHDLLRRSEEQLEHYEAALGLAGQEHRRQQWQRELEQLAVHLEMDPQPALWRDFWQCWRRGKEGE